MTEPVSAEGAGSVADPRALSLLLAEMQRHLPVTGIDELWIFPPRSTAGGQSVLALVSVFDEERGRRRVFTVQVLRSLAGAERSELETSLVEQGTAPLEVVSRLVPGLVRRLGEPLPGELDPLYGRIAGDGTRWEELRARLGVPLDLPPDSTFAINNHC